jgi:FtsH-binding integral membrane protein
MVDVVATIWAIAMICLNAYFLNYVYELEKGKCECSLTWRRKFIEATLVVFLVLGAANLIGWSVAFVPLLSVLMLVVSVVYVVITRQYINDISHTHCKCAETTAYKVLNVVNIINIVILVLAFAVVLYRLFATMSGPAAAAASVARKAAVKGRRA